MPFGFFRTLIADSRDIIVFPTLNRHVINHLTVCRRYPERSAAFRLLTRRLRPFSCLLPVRSRKLMAPSQRREPSLLLLS
ncbi:MAG: hypothetical protein J6Y84_07560 [Bacteroidaceae bacterium]|nr:hypothetical protein [Bacteroidaceae bacterium]